MKRKLAKKKEQSQFRYAFKIELDSTKVISVMQFAHLTPKQ